MIRRPCQLIRAAGAAALALALATTVAAGESPGDLDEPLAIYLAAVAEVGEPTPEMLGDVTRRLRELLPPERAVPIVVDRLLAGIEDETRSAALVMVLDELGLSRGELLKAAAGRLSAEDDALRAGATIYLGGFLVRPEVEIDTKYLVLELLEPHAEHAAPLAPSLLALQLLQHGRNTPSMVTAIDALLATALPDEAARAVHGVPGLVELARAEEGNLRGLAMLKLGEWKIATPAAVEVLLENLAYREGDPALARRVRIVAAQTIGDLAPGIGKLDPAIGFDAQRRLMTAGAGEPDEGLRELIVHVGTLLGRALSR